MEQCDLNIDTIILGGKPELKIKNVRDSIVLNCKFNILLKQY